MFKLTKAQIEKAGKIAWGSFPPYIQEDYIPAIISFCGGSRIDPRIFDVVLIIITERFVPSEDKALVFNEVPVFIRSLKIGEEGEEAIDYLPSMRIW